MSCLPPGNFNRKVSVLMAKMDHEFALLHERLDAMSGGERASEELMRPVKLSSVAQYNAFRKQLKFVAFRRKLVSAD